VANTLAISADGKRLASTGGNLNVRVWNLAADPPTFVDIPNSAVPLYSRMAFRPDGARLVTQNSDGALRMWDTSGPAPKEVWTKPFPGFGVAFQGSQLAFTPDGNTLVVFSGRGLVHFLDVSGPEPKWLNPIDPNEPCGREIVFGPDGHVGFTRAAD